MGVNYSFFSFFELDFFFLITKKQSSVRFRVRHTQQFAVQRRGSDTEAHQKVSAVLQRARSGASPGPLTLERERWEHCLTRELLLDWMSVHDLSQHSSQ